MKMNLILIGLFAVGYIVPIHTGWWANLSVLQKRNVQNATKCITVGTACLVLSFLLDNGLKKNLRQLNQQKRGIQSLSDMIWGKDLFTDVIENKQTKSNVDWSYIQGEWLLKNMSSINIFRSSTSYSFYGKIVLSPKNNTDFESAIQEKNLDKIAHSLEKMIKVNKSLEVLVNNKLKSQSGQQKFLRLCDGCSFLAVTGTLWNTYRFLGNK